MGRRSCTGVRRSDPLYTLKLGELSWVIGLPADIRDSCAMASAENPQTLQLASESEHVAPSRSLGPHSPKKGLFFLLTLARP